MGLALRWITVNDAFDPSHWIRLDHQGLGMPVPAVYVPAPVLDGQNLRRLGFVSVLDRDATADLPMSRRLAADVMTAPDRMTLLVFDKDFGKSRKATVQACPAITLEGRYADAADEQWQNAAYLARNILLLTGPPPTSSTVPFQLLFDPNSKITAVRLTTVAQ
jgi:hypothetical protein